MKTYCTTCGCHFPEDFQETMEPECTFWSSRGFPVEFENREKWLQEIWTAMFSVDADAMANECKVAITLLDLKAYTNIQAVDDGVNQFEEHVPGYKDWDDEKRKRFQKAWIKESRRPGVSEMVWNHAMGTFAQQGWEDEGDL